MCAQKGLKKTYKVKEKRISIGLCKSECIIQVPGTKLTIRGNAVLVLRRGYKRCDE